MEPSDRQEVGVSVDRFDEEGRRVLRVAGVQLAVRVGDVEGNADLAVEAIRWAAEQGADVVVLPELAIPGYPPQDLLLSERFIDANLAALDRVAEATADLPGSDVVAVVGFADRVPPVAGADAADRSLANAVALCHDGRVVARHHKTLLPNYGVFDEARYFAPGTDPHRTVGIRLATVGVAVCEDLWRPDIVEGQAAAGAQLLLAANASPYHRGKRQTREELVRDTARRTAMPVVYVNCVGGREDLVFDGGSLVADASGEVIVRCLSLAPDRFCVDVPATTRPRTGPTRFVAGAARSTPAERPAETAPLHDPLDDDAETYGALVMALRDFVRTSKPGGFDHLVLGLSGGIDSALVAALAVDAVGPGKVWGVGMPSEYSSGHSVEDARELARRLGIRLDLVPITGMFTAAREALADVFAGTDFDVAEENLQARSRGMALMAIANKFDGIVLATGNKSEGAVGYATLYGDMAGGYAPIKDVPKTLVTRLCRWRNAVDPTAWPHLGWQGPREPIPERTIDKPPSAELSPDQMDTDSLPPYPVLDRILEGYVECGWDVPRITAALEAAGVTAEEAGAADGLESLVRRVVRMVDGAEHKRRQAAPGPKVTARAFGSDRRLPLTAGFAEPAGGAPAMPHIGPESTEAEAAAGVPGWVLPEPVGSEPR
jgi:NAD+ synthase (glutamine-hydrolysing)